MSSHARLCLPFRPSTYSEKLLPGRVTNFATIFGSFDN